MRKARRYPWMVRNIICGSASGTGLSLRMRLGFIAPSSTVAFLVDSSLRTGDTRDDTPHLRVSTSGGLLPPPVPRNGRENVHWLFVVEAAVYTQAITTEHRGPGPCRSAALPLCGNGTGVYHQRITAVASQVRRRDSGRACYSRRESDQSLSVMWGRLPWGSWQQVVRGMRTR